MLSTSLLLAASMVVGQLPDQAVNELSYYVGEWDFQWTVDGVEYSGKWFVKWAPDKSCLVSHWKSVNANGPASGQKITSWDVAKTQVIDLDCGSTGAHSFSRGSKAADNLWNGEITGATSDGKTSMCKYELKQEADKFTWTRTERKEGGEPQPDLIFVFRKVKKATE